MSVGFRKEDQVGYIEFDLPDSKVNILSAETLKRLGGILDEVRINKSLKALVLLSLKKDIFIAGADIKEIENITESQDGIQKAKYGQNIFNKLEDLKVPTIALIDGVALGGGCELILSCDYRLATFNEKVRIGLPEVNLGILPGFGGTYRLPRVVGLIQGLTLILTGKTLDGKKAHKIGLVDHLIPQTNIEVFLNTFIEKIQESSSLKGKYQRRRKIPLVEKLSFLHPIIFSGARKNVLKKSQGRFPAPLKIIEVVKQNFYCSREKGLNIESSAFGELVITDISKTCIHLFYLFEKYKKLKFPGTEDVQPMAIHKCGILGAGIMGGGIAQLLSANGIWSRVKDINYDSIAKGFQAASKVYRQAVKRRRLTKAEAEKGMARITGTLDYSGFGNVDIVIEAVVEDLKVKKQVFKELSQVTSERTILASNTSALSVTAMAQETNDPSKVIGFHFFNPVHQMPLVEVITTAKTSQETIATALALVKQLRKTPIVVKDSCGFLVNRILLGYINEAGRILEEKGDMDSIDRVMTDFGMPMGPFMLTDEVGIDVGFKVLKILEEGLGERYQPAKIFKDIYHKKFLGKKSGKGFYLHGKKKVKNPVVEELLDDKPRGDLDHEKNCQRMTYIMINEAAHCLEEKIVDDPGAIDVGMIAGTGFPLFRGGLLKYADSLGIEEVVGNLELLEKEFEAERFKPADLLLQMREAKRKFFGKE